jgi:DNA-binding NarL/FixJ family response regulator
MPAFQTSPVSPFKPVGTRTSLEVLILDDERFDRHRLARLCSGLEFACTVSNATSLTEFRNQLDQTTFGLILLDYSLPDGTGLDALDMMHLCARNMNTPALMVSGLAESGIVDRAEAAGCCGFLEKDALSSDAFARAVKDALVMTAPLSPASAKHFDAEEVAQLLTRAVAHSAQDIKPMVSRLMRHMRNLRAQNALNDCPATDAAEQNCLSLWSFLIEMERQDGATLLAHFTDAAGTAKRAQSEPKSNRPPSPFSSGPH